MKLIIGELVSLITKKQESNIRVLAKFFLVLLAMVIIYSILFHVLMLAENDEIYFLLIYHLSGQAAEASFPQAFFLY